MDNARDFWVNAGWKLSCGLKLYQPLTIGEHILRQLVSNVCPHLRYLHPSQIFFHSLLLDEGKLINQFLYLENKDNALFPFQRDFENWRVL